jgi:hypothetical protein
MQSLNVSCGCNAIRNSTCERSVRKSLRTHKSFHQRTRSGGPEAGSRIIITARIRSAAVKAPDRIKRLTVAAVHPKDAGPVLEIQETSAGRLSHLVIKLAFVACLRRRAATKSRNARVLNGSRPGPRWTRLTGNASGSYLASTIFSLFSATAFAA